MAETYRKELSRPEIVDALSKSVEIFTSHSEEDFNDVMSNGLRPVAKAVGLDRIAVFQLTDGNTTLGQTYVWAYGNTATLDKELLEMPDNPPVTRWLSQLKKGGCINSNVNEMTKDQADFLGRFGIKSIFIVPIFTHNKFWGIVALEDHTLYRLFDEDCLDLLRSAARLCANAFIRNEMTQNANKAIKALRRREKMLRTLNETAIRFLSESEETFEDMMNAGIGLIVDLADLDRISVWRNFKKDGNLHSSQIYRWDKESGGTTNPDKEMKDLTFADTIPHWEKVLKANEVINSPAQFLPEMKFLKSFGVVSLCVTPVFINNEFWGFVLFEDRENERYFDEESVEMMKSAAFLCANTVIRYEMEREIDAVNELTRAVTEASPIAYVLFNEDLRAIDCNEAMMQIFECSDKQYLLDHYWDVFIPLEQPGGHDSYKEALAKREESLAGNRASFEWVHRSLHGELIPMENTLTQVIYKGKKLFISFKYDLRSTKEMMENIRNQSELLKDALNKATIASKAKGVFLSNMSHEIRTPLNAIIGMTTIGKNVTDIARKDHALNKIEDASKHLLGVINDILDMSKIEANKFELSPVEFNFEHMIQRVVDVINFRIGEKQQNLSVYLDKSIPGNLIGDDQRIAQVITNLLGNAIKFTPGNGFISLDTRFLGEKDGLCTIQISVKDTGIGISKEQQERLFKSFQQAESSTVRKFGGTGLGLAISKNIVEMMDGNIRVESEPDAGSVFSFTIQVKKGSEKITSRSSLVNLKNVSILAVDDDPDVLEYLKEILSGFGTSCDVAKNAEEALRLVNQNGPYDVYFIDWKMPGIDGITLTSMLKSSISTMDDSVVIMISAFDWNLIEDEAKKAGIEKFLSKPLFPSAIADIINECLGMEEDADDGSSDITGLFKGYTILLAEDMEINREIVLSLLEPSLINIECAENGAEAVRMWSEDPEKYDLIFMDVQMPEMDGYEATRRIREIEKERFPGDKNLKADKQTPQVPIIAMTANVFTEDVIKCHEAGMNSHLGKPLEYDKLVDKLRSILPAINTG